MLSRIAESLFWIGRYVERADDTARILDVQTQLLVEDPWVDERHAPAAPCCAIMGADDRPTSGVDTGERAATGWPSTPTSPTLDRRRASAAARENARRARETLSTELWESLNTTYRDRRAGPLPGDADRTVAFRWVRERAAMINGTRRRDDEPRRGLAVPRARPLARARGHDRPAGRHLGAQPGTPRRVDARCCAPAAPTSRTCAPTAGWRPSRAAAEFLLLDRLFPRSVVHALSRAEQCLANLEASGQPGRLPGRGAAAARPGPRRARVPLASPTSSPTCPARWSGCSAPAPRRATPSRTATSRTPWR